MERYFPCEHDIVPKTIYRYISLIEALRYYQKYRGKSTGRYSWLQLQLSETRIAIRIIYIQFWRGYEKGSEESRRKAHKTWLDKENVNCTVSYMWDDTYINSIYLREYQIFDIQYFPFEFSLSPPSLPSLLLRLKINSVSKELNSNAFLREKDSLLTFQRRFKKVSGMVRRLSE